MKGLVILATALLLAACAAPTMKVIYKEGSLKAERVRALDECEFESVKEIPRAMATEVSGGYSSPGSVQCNTFGGITNCQTIGAINIPASSQNYDANLQTRLRYMDSCLQKKGYSVLVVPVCRTDEEKAAALARDKQTAASDSNCGIKDRDLR